MSNICGSAGKAGFDTRTTIMQKRRQMEPQIGTRILELVRCSEMRLATQGSREHRAWGRT